jgi:hypothetical protein
MAISIPGNFLTVMKNVMLGASGQLDGSWLRGGVGPNQFFSQIFSTYICHKDRDICSGIYGRVSLLPAFIWLLIGIYIYIRCNKRINKYVLLFLISSVQFLPAVAMTYTLVWLPFAIAILISESSRLLTTKHRRLIFLGMIFCFLSLSSLNLDNVLSTRFPFNDWREMHLLTGTYLLCLSVYFSKANLGFSKHKKLLYAD